MHHLGSPQVQALPLAQVQFAVQVRARARARVLPFRMLLQKHLLFSLILFYRLLELQEFQLQGVALVSNLVMEASSETEAVQKLVLPLVLQAFECPLQQPLLQLEPAEYMLFQQRLQPHFH